MHLAPFLPSAEIELNPQKQELLPLPKKIASPTPSPNSKPIAISQIQGMPIDLNCQAVEQPTQAIAVEPFGTYAPGGGLCKLTPKGSPASPLYLTLAPDRQGTGTIVTI